MAGLARRVVRAKAPKSWEWACGKGPAVMVEDNFFVYRRFKHLVELLKSRPDGWFLEGWSAAVVNELADAVRTLKRRFGKNPAKWAWGRVRPLEVKNAVLGSRWPFRKAVNLPPVPYGGDEHTPNHQSPRVMDPTGPVQTFPGLRAVIDVGAWEHSRWSIAGGQSANPLSPNYADLYPLWLEGVGVPVAFTDAAARAASVQELRLSPG